MSADSFSIQVATATHRINKAVEHLMGLVGGMIADAQLADLEIQYLRTWLREHPEATGTFPGNIIAHKVNEVLEDGVITDAERAHLLQALQEMAANDFSHTGSAAPEVTGLPIEDCVTVDFTNAMVCFTGEFLYGTRAACERLVLKAGAQCADSVSKKVDILVIGTRVSPDWAHSSFGRKIQRAVELQDKGHAIEIISERKMMNVLSLN